MLQKEYLELNKNSANRENALEISMNYDLGGYNWFNGQQNKRGYYLYCNPVEVREEEYRGRKYNTYTEILGKGSKILLKEVSRQSKKAEAEAEQIALKRKQELIDYVVSAYGLEIKG